MKRGAELSTEHLSGNHLIASIQWLGRKLKRSGRPKYIARYCWEHLVELSVNNSHHQLLTKSWREADGRYFEDLLYTTDTTFIERLRDPEDGSYITNSEGLQKKNPGGRWNPPWVGQVSEYCGAVTPLQDHVSVRYSVSGLAVYGGSSISKGDPEGVFQLLVDHALLPPLGTAAHMCMLISNQRTHQV